MSRNIGEGGESSRSEEVNVSECVCVEAVERVGGWVVESLFFSKEKKETPKKQGD